MHTGLLEHMRTFVRAVESGSFTHVAREQGQSQPTVSRQITALEEHLGVRLLQRTTRALTMTEEGRAYYAHAHAVLDAAEQAAMAVKTGVNAVSGQLRIAAPLAFARLHLVPRLEPFLAQHPKLSVDVVMGDRAVDLVEEGIDLAIRIGVVRDQSLIVRKIGVTRRMVLATPQLVAQAGRPTTPEHLSDMDCIRFSGLSTGDQWPFRGREGSSFHVTVGGRVKLSASEGVRAAVLGGLGFALCPTWLFSDEIETGRLVQVLEDYEPEPLSIQAVMPSRRMVTPRVRAFVDYIAAAFANDTRLKP